MPGFSGLPNLGGALENPIEGISSALANAPVAAADQNAALNQKGWQALAPYVTAMSRNPNLAQNNTFTGQMQRIAQMYRISGPMLDQAIQQVRSQLGGTGSAGMTGSGAVQTGPAQVAPQGAGAPSQGAPAAQPSPSQTSSAASQSQPTTKPVGSEPDLGTKWADPRLKQLADVYNQDLEAAARTPALTGHPDFHQKIVKDGRAVGRTNSEIAADVKAYQVKAGKGPHPETMPPDQAQVRTQRQQALQQGTQAGTPSQPGTQSAPASGVSQGSPQPQVSAVPPGTPGAGAAGPTSYEGPHALPPAMQGLMAAAGVTPTGMQAYGTSPIEAGMAQQIAQAQPSDRPQLYAAAMIDPTTVPSDIMNAKPVMTETQRGIEWQRVYTDAITMAKNGQDPTGVIQSAAAGGVITPDMAASFLQNPQLMEPLRAAAQNYSTIFRQNGVLKGARYQNYLSEIATAKTTRELNQARTQYLGKQVQWVGSLAQAHIAEAWASVSRNNAEAGAIQDGSWFQQNTAQNRSVTDQMRDAQALLTSANKNYSDILSYSKSLVASFQDPTSATLPDGTPLAQALQTAKDQRDAAQSAINILKGQAGNSATSTVNAASGGAKVKGHPIPPGATPGTLPDGKHGYQLRGTLFYDNGQQYKQ
jgi:hypothetical protein